MEVQYVYTKKRAEFGRHANFSDRPAESHVDIAPDREVRKNFLHRNPCHAEVQASYPMSEHYVNTEVTQTVSTASNHVEGGWPKDVNPNEMEQVARYRKKVEKDEAYIQTILKLASIAEDVIRSNNAIDIYEDYFNEEEDDTDYDATPRARTVNVFRDPCEKKRSAVHMSWHPDGAERLVAAYSDISFEQSDSGISYDSYVWNSINPNKPEMILRPPAPSVCVEYNPKDAHEILSGLKSGQVCIWDTRRGGVPVMTSNRDVSHRDPVHSALWMQSKTGKDFFSGSTDGLIKWWDARKLDQPLEELILDVTKNLDISKALGCVSLEFESTIPTKFMVGTEHGCIISCNRKAKTQQDKIAAVFSGHVGPVYSLQRNPIFPKMFLSVGDWSAKIFSEDIRDAAIYSTPGLIEQRKRCRNI
ncbi:unnamed protein product [Oikopleura dioica]|uniref:Uncharacterized protein n=1 Tax=Oikopleura dioica TaxID=34765 RepID=E4YT00_OIKDI|nr:unnamed protein product [Oikopleura dioica]